MPKSDIFSESLNFHKKLRGKLSIQSKVPLNSRKALSLAYTPGVAQPCLEIAKKPETVFDYTIKCNSVAVVSDGSAVLGLGNIGPEAAIPVMEGKALLFKEFANIDAFPICLATQNPQEIIKTVRLIAPVFGGINLEDISAPRCFEIENSLQDLGIPVFHDDQHGTEVVALAALMNACKVVRKNLADLKVVIFGAGAAGVAVAKTLQSLNQKIHGCTSVDDIILIDKQGPIYKGRPSNDHSYKHNLAGHTNKHSITSTPDAVANSDVLIGLSAPGIVSKDMVSSMAENAIVFAMSNPTPEIMPKDAFSAGAAIVGTGRSDFPNQINNVLAFPGIFRGALDAKAKTINQQMRISAAAALASLIKKPSKTRILPYALEKTVVKAVSAAVKKTAYETGAAQNK